MNGIILVNKPKGISSNKVVNKVKHILGASKAGHLGTLDLLGEGLLPVTLNSATKLFDYFLNKDKVYVASFMFSKQTDTLDLEGKIIYEDNKIITKEDIEKVLPKFVGKFNQMPPNYSAKKINGKKAYELARKNKEVSLKPKEIEIYSIKLLKELNTNEFLFEIHCSSGTYIRSLARDIASSLSTYGLMSNIIRTRCGSFMLKDAFTLEEIESGNYKILPCEEVFDYKKILLSKQEEDRILNGVKLKNLNEDGLYKVYGKEFLGVGEVKNNELTLKIRLI